MGVGERERERKEEFLALFMVGDVITFFNFFSFLGKVFNLFCWIFRDGHLN